MAAGQQRVGREVGFAAQLDDALGEAVGVARLLVRVFQELGRHLRRRQAVRGEVVALVAQDAHQLGGQRVVQQLDDLVAVGPVAGRDRAVVEAALGGVESRRERRGRSEAAGRRPH